MKKSQKKKLLFTLLILFFLILALVSACNIVTILTEYHTADKASAELQQYIDLNAVQEPTEKQTQPAAMETEGEAFPADEAATEAATEPVDTFPYPVVDFESLYKINEDVVGWIYIEDTVINYPLVQGTDNKRYVERMVDGRYNAAGSIFLDYRNSWDFSDKNSVLYGHNMKNGSMFAQILKYRDAEFFEAHPIGMIITPERKFRFEVIAGYVTDVYDDAWQLSFADDDTFLQWLQDSMNRSVIGGTFDIDVSDRIVTLSTCTYEFEDARFILVCRIME